MDIFTAIWLQLNAAEPIATGAKSTMGDRSRPSITLLTPISCLLNSESKIVFVDVLFGKHRRRTEKNLAAVNDLEFAKFAGVQFSVTGLQLSVDHRAHCVSGSIPQIDRVP